MLITSPQIFTLLIFTCSVFASNMAFGYFRSKLDGSGPQHMYQHPPPTPHRFPSGGMIDSQAYYNTPYQTPYHDRTQMMGIEPMPSGAPNWGQQGPDSPTKTPSRQLSFR